MGGIVSDNPMLCTRCAEELDPYRDPPRGVCWQCWREEREEKAEEPDWEAVKEEQDEFI